MTRSEENQRGHQLTRRMQALPASVFQFDGRIRDGWLSDRYFLRAAATLEHAGRDPEVTMQVFAKRTGVVAGLFEAVRLLETQLADGYSPEDIAVSSLLDGDRVEPWDTVLLIQGPYRAFAHLETPLLGTLARRSLVATNVAEVVAAANGKNVIWMPARHDDWRIQAADGYAARVGGIEQVSTDAGGAWWGAEGVGTMPHALIAAMDGDTVAATLAFARYVRSYEPGVHVVSLTDFNNDVVADSLAVARAMEAEFGAGALTAVRIDTSEKLIDRSLIEADGIWGREKLTGVCAPLVRTLRDALDSAGFEEVGIVVSGGFTPEKIEAFETAGLPVTAYGVGSSLIRGAFDFTGDIVETNGSACAKVGRRLNPNPRLVPVDWDALAEGREAA